MERKSMEIEQNPISELQSLLSRMSITANPNKIDINQSYLSIGYCFEYLQKQINEIKSVIVNQAKR
jgi:hypothetical protein